MNIQCDNIILKRRLDIFVVTKMGKTAIIIDVAIPGDKIITKNFEKYVDKIGIKTDLHTVQ